VGYSESSKAYRIYIPGQRQIEVSRDVTFEEEVTFRRSRGSHMDIDSERKEDMVISPLTLQKFRGRQLSLLIQLIPLIPYL
jgi:hypothetical protein